MSYLPGTRVGKFEVQSHPVRVNGENLVLVKCECGKIINVEENDLVNGHITSCGCAGDSVLVKPIKLSRTSSSNLPVGYRCGKYEVLSDERIKHKGQFYVECKCHGCGSIHLVKDFYLKHNMVRACIKCAKKV